MHVAFSINEEDSQEATATKENCFMSSWSQYSKDIFYDLQDIRVHSLRQDTTQVGEAIKADPKALFEAKNRLKEDENLNDEEKRAKLDNFEKNGYFTYPVTSVMDRKKTIIEFKKDTKPKTEEELLNELDLSHLEGDQREMMRKVFKDNVKVFSRSELDIPPCPIIKCKPELTEEAKKKGIQNAKFQEFPSQIKDQVEEVLSSMIEAGILKISNKPTHLVSNLLCMAKKDSSPRLVLDARLCNMSVQRIPFQLESMESVFQKFHGSTVTSSVDLSNSYYSVEIEESRQPIFSFFNSKRQLLTFARLPMGFLNAGFYLSQITNKIKERNPGVASFVDDLYLVSYSSFADHCQQMDKLLKTLIEFNLRIKPKKCQPASKCLDVLGHCWQTDRFKIGKGRLQGILDWDTPRSLDEVASYTGHLGFYRRYVPEIAECLIPLQELATLGIEYKKKKKAARITKEKIKIPKFAWETRHNQAFLKSKELFAKYNEMFPADTTKPYYCFSDASMNCCSFIVTQVDEEGNSKLIGAASRKFTSSESSMSIFKKEVVATLYGFKTFNALLSFSKVYLSVDAKSIIFLKSSRNSDPLLTRWALTMSTFDVVIKHIPGIENKRADELSRSRSAEEEKDEDPFLTADEAEAILQHITILGSFTIDRDLFKKFMTEDGLRSPFSSSKKKKSSSKATVTPKIFLLQSNLGGKLLLLQQAKATFSTDNKKGN